MARKQVGTTPSNGADAITKAFMEGAFSGLGIGESTNQIGGFWQGTQAQYDAIGTKDSNTLYVVKD